MRWKSPATARASAFTSSVFPTPGTPSMSACPPASSVTSARSIASFWPTITRLRASRTRRAPLMIVANDSDDCVAAPPDCACPSESSTGFSFMRSVPPKKSSTANRGTIKTYRGRHEPDPLRKPGVPLSARLIPYIPPEEAARARCAASRPKVDLQKWPAHPAASSGGTVPSTLPLSVLSRCSVEVGVAPPRRRLRHGARSAHWSCAPGVALDRHSYSKATPTESPRRAAEQLAAGNAALAKVHPHPGAVRATFHRPRLRAVHPRENLTAPGWDAS